MDAEYGSTGQEKKKKTTEKVYRCSDGGRAEGWWWQREMPGWGETEADDLLWERPKEEDLSSVIIHICTNKAVFFY